MGGTQNVGLSKENVAQALSLVSITMKSLGEEYGWSNEANEALYSSFYSPDRPRPEGNICFYLPFECRTPSTDEKSKAERSQLDSNRNCSRDPSRTNEFMILDGGMNNVEHREPRALIRFCTPTKYHLLYCVPGLQKQFYG